VSIEIKKMPSYIFLSGEGSTFQPGSESEVPDIENLQVIGISDGVTPAQALRNLLEENYYLRETTFQEIFCYELSAGYERTRTDFDLKRIWGERIGGT
jgi:hypothetical protein